MKRSKQNKKNKFQNVPCYDVEILDFQEYEILPSGKDYTAQSLQDVIDEIKCEKTKKYLDTFIENGGKFELELLNGNILEYVPDENAIKVDHRVFIKCYEENDVSQITSCISHELHHDMTYKKANGKGCSLDYYDDEYNEKSMQIINVGLEVGANNFQLVSGWEQGGEKMQSYLKKDFKDLFDNVSDFLNDNGVEFGKKIPENLLPAVANMTAFYFVKNDGVKYKKTLLQSLTPMQCDPEGKKDFPVKKLFEIMECPSDFSEKELEDILLINKDEENMIPVNLVPFVTMSTNESKFSINKKINSYKKLPLEISQIIGLGKSMIEK